MGILMGGYERYGIYITEMDEHGQARTGVDRHGGWLR